MILPEAVMLPVILGFAIGAFASSWVWILPVRPSNLPNSVLPIEPLCIWFAFNLVPNTILFTVRVPLELISPEAVTGLLSSI